MIKYQKPLKVIIDDPIAIGLCRYTDVWNHYFGKHTVSLGIRGDKVEDVIWHTGNLDANKELRYVVLTCTTNNINKNVPEDIINSIKYAIQLIKYNFFNKATVSGILPQNFSPGIQRKKIRSVNLPIK